jgi:hypothetical protein
VFASFANLVIVPGIPAAALFCWMWLFARTRDKCSRRPFDDMPRPAGWSLQNRTNDLMEKVLTNFMMAGMIGAVVWALSLTAKSSPAIFQGLGFVFGSFFIWRSARYVHSYSNHRLGLVGEQVVGQILDRLSSDSIRVFHDLEIREPGRKPWNIDHVVLTSAGVFSIETKCRRKPRGIAPDGQQGHKLIFDGQKLIFPHPIPADRNGLDQAQNNATWLANKLTALNGAPVPVTPVLVFPGWWVDLKGKGPVSVLNHKLLPGFFNGRKSNLSEQQHRAIANQLDERCRIEL